MALPEKVREEARRILGEADLDNTNGRTIKTLIGESLDLSKEQLKEFKFLIEVHQANMDTSHMTCIIVPGHGVERFSNFKL